jgi:UDP-GlcNAc3NAcA epimerase
MRVLTVVGNRPQFVKAAAVSGPLRAAHDEVLLHTGQHHDDELSTIFVRELGLPAPDRELGIAGGSNTSQTARMLGALESELDTLAPDAVLVYGDTNSTLAGALAAGQRRLPVAHVEAGMRSYDRAMPEELNRVLTDHLAALLLCSSEAAAGNLRREGVLAGVEVVGDVMVDVARLFAPAARARGAGILARFEVTPGEYVLSTAHRPGTVDDPDRLRRLVALLRALPLPAVLPLHPRTRARLQAAGLLAELQADDRVRLAPPLGYLDFTALLLGARAVLTDSGGVQKEAYLAGVPCVTLRDRTEWTETVQTGWNALVDLDAQAALRALEAPPPGSRPPLYGDGYAGDRVVDALGTYLTR